MLLLLSAQLLYILHKLNIPAVNFLVHLLTSLKQDVRTVAGAPCRASVFEEFTFILGRFQFSNQPPNPLSCITMCVLHYNPTLGRVDQNSNKSQAWKPPLSAQCWKLYYGADHRHLITRPLGKLNFSTPRNFGVRKKRQNCLLGAHACANACPPKKRGSR